MKKLREDKLSISVLIVGLILAIGIIFFDFFYARFWIFALLFGLALGLFLFALLLIGFYKDNSRSLKLGFTFALVAGITLILKSDYLSDYLKSPSVLEARLYDDLSGLSLTLRQNGEFELESYSLFYSETFTGKYKTDGNRIIFLNKPYENDFVPDTTFIVDDKIILKFDKEGLPVTKFATYFEIKKNNLNAP
jgi:hypothetical protein